MKEIKQIGFAENRREIAAKIRSAFGEDFSQNFVEEWSYIIINEAELSQYEDYSIENKANNYYITIEKENDDDVYECDISVCVNNDEFLYGGKNQWFYGIWKSTWTEDEKGNVKEVICDEMELGEPDEKGRRKPNTNHLKALSDFFNVSIEYLCGIEKDNKEDIEKISKIISRSPILYNYVNKDSRISIMNLEKYILSLSQNRCKLK